MSCMIKTMGRHDATVASDCDEWIFFGDTITKGKKNDHALHNNCLEHIISFYDSERSRDNFPPIKNNIVHADNCPTQCKCLQNFFKNETFGDLHGRNKLLIHNFA